MNKKLLVLLPLGLIVLAIAYLGLNNDSPMQDMTGINNSESAAPMTSNTQTADETQTVGEYKDYAESEFSSTNGTRLLFFHAPWCPQCRSLETSIKSSQIPAGVTIFKVDYDSSQSLRQKYGVTIQTTVVRVDEQGNLVKKYVAYDDPSFANVAENLL